MHNYEWKEFTIDDEVIKQVHELSQKEGQKLLPNNYPMFEWSPVNQILYLYEDVSPIDDNEIKEHHEKLRISHQY